MRRLLAALFLVLSLGISASAQETYSIAAGAPDVATLTDILTFYNVKSCQGLALAPTRTQAQSCTAAGAAGGAACTAGQARAAGARIWPITQAGREEFVTFMIAVPRFTDLAGGIPALKASIQTTAALAATTLNKNASCTSLGLPAGCYP